MYKLNVHTPLECKRFDPFTWTTKENKKKKNSFRRVVQDSPRLHHLERIRLTLSTCFLPEDKSLQSVWLSFENYSLHHRRIAVRQRVLAGDRADRRSLRRVQIGVLGLSMPSQVDLPLECPAAKLAGERFEARVLPRMRDQVTALWERFAAYLTLVRFLAWKRKFSQLRKNSHLYPIFSTQIKIKVKIIYNILLVFLIRILPNTNHWKHVASSYLYYISSRDI